MGPFNSSGAVKSLAMLIGIGVVQRRAPAPCWGGPSSWTVRTSERKLAVEDHRMTDAELIQSLLDTIPSMDAEELVRCSAMAGKHGLVTPKVEAAFVKRIKKLERDARADGFISDALKQVVRIWLGA